ncbi:MAG TPA: serine hydrolase domain-containing protein [Pseudonocardiaceae bacterium]|nr:serine hydrolase domain-containing protein [Pseudonocardiaceae bacterium]
MTVPATGLSERLDASLRTITSISRAPAAVLAVITGTDTAIACRGDPSPGADTVFELGSITKTFTAVLLAEMVARGEVSYDDPITAYLPPHARPRRVPTTPVTLLHLATHTGGLPRLPANLYRQALPAWGTNPYARYRLDDLYQATARIRPRHPAGTHVRYSNFGIGLLGQLLANAVNNNYADLVLDRVCRPLGMTDTRTGPGASCSTGYRRGRPMPAWEMGALAAAGTLRSSATDLLRYLHAHLDPQTTPLPLALRATQIPRVAAKGEDRICLVWNHRRSRHGDLLFHSGATRGFTAFLGFCPQAQTGIAALVNSTPTHRHTMVPTAYTLFKTLIREHQTAPP